MLIKNSPLPALVQDLWVHNRVACSMTELTQFLNYACSVCLCTSLTGISRHSPSDKGSWSTLDVECLRIKRFQTEWIYDGTRHCPSLNKAAGLTSREFQLPNQILGPSPFGKRVPELNLSLTQIQTRYGDSSFKRLISLSARNDWVPSTEYTLSILPTRS